MTHLTATVRLLLQLRLLLAAVALLLLPRERLTLPIFLVICAFAVLTWLISRNWERLAPYIQRHPFLMASDALIAATVLALDGPTGPFFMATVLTATITGLLYGTTGIALMAGLQIACYFAALASNSAMTNEAVQVVTFQVLLLHPVLYPIAGFVGLQLRQLFVQLTMEQEARQHAEITAAAAEERSRLARDMHDSVAKTLQGTALAAKAIPLWIARDPARAAATAQQVADAAAVAAEEARSLLQELRSKDSGRPISEDLRIACTEWSDSAGVPVELNLTEQPLPMLVAARQEAVAILGEALTNVSRHAGATSVSVSLDRDGDHAQLAISDNGVGFDPAKLPEGHFGVIGMRERAESAGGSLEVASSPGSGSRVTVRLPLAAPTHSPSARSTASPSFVETQ